MKLLFPFLAYAVVVLFVFDKALYPSQNEVIFGPDIWRYHYFQRPFLGESFRSGIVPWWNPYIMGGQPYLEQPQITTWYLPNLLFTILPANRAISWYLALHIFWAMAGIYLFISNFKFQISNLAAWAAGIAFGLSGYFAARIYAGHIDIIAASSWLPWVIASVVSCQASVVSRKRNCVITAIFFAMMLLAGHQMVAVYTVEAIGVAALVYAVVQRSLRPLVISTVSIALGLGLAAIQILPNHQLIANSIRTIQLPEAWSVIATPTAAHFLEFIDPTFFYDRLPDVGLGHEHVGYIGKVPLLFAITTILFFFLRRKKSVEILILIILSIFSLWVWLGPNAPVDMFAVMRKILPLYGQIRIPSRHIVLFILAASALFGIGMSRVKNTVVRLLLCALVLLDLIPFARANIHLGQIPETREDGELVALLAGDEGLYRFLPDFYHGQPLRDALEFDAPITKRIFSVSGYETPPLRNYWEFLLAVNNLDIAKNLDYIETTPPFINITSPYLNFLNVKYILTPTGSDSLDAYPRQFSQIKENKDRGYRVYENKEVLPRFYFVQNAVVAARATIDEAIRGGSGDPGTMVYLEQETMPIPRPCSQTTTPTVSVTTYQSDRILLQISNPCDSYLVSSEVMYPGWMATIDGKETKIAVGNLAFRTIFVPAGDHIVQMQYRPRIVYLGALVSLVSLVVFFWLIYDDGHGIAVRKSLHTSSAGHNHPASEESRKKDCSLPWSV